MVTSLVHAAHPGPHRLAEVRDLCDLAFDDDDYGDATFQHALGGTTTSWSPTARSCCVGCASAAAG